MSTSTSGAAPSRLARRLSLGDAIFVGLGAMIGAGVFVALAPAAGAAGTGLLIGLALAGAVAACNAASSAALAAVHPASGGTYVYGRRQLGPFWGFLAGWGFIVGKVASCAAMALTIGAHAWPRWQRPIAVTAVVALTAVNALGIRKTALAAKVIVTAVLAVLAVAVAGIAFGGATSTARLGGADADIDGVLQSAGVLFFAFAGYARVATLGEEVVEPERTIPRATAAALGATLAVYAVVAAAVLLALGPHAVAESDAPVVDAVRVGRLADLGALVRVGGALAALGVLLSLIAGVSRTVFAMAADREFPSWFEAVHPSHRVPHRAVWATGALIAALAAAADLRDTIAFSSFCVLTYYAIANASAWTLPQRPRRLQRRLAAAGGLVGCVTLAITLPEATVVSGAGVLVVGATVWAVHHRFG